MRIGITCSDLVFLDNIRIYANGHHFNVIMWYHFFEKCGYDILFLSDKLFANSMEYSKAKRLANRRIFIFLNTKNLP